MLWCPWQCRQSRNAPAIERHPRIEPVPRIQAHSLRIVSKCDEGSIRRLAPDCLLQGFCKEGSSSLASLVIWVHKLLRPEPEWFRNPAETKSHNPRTLLRDPETLRVSGHAEAWEMYRGAGTLGSKPWLALRLLILCRTSRAAASRSSSQAGLSVVVIATSDTVQVGRLPLRVHIQIDPARTLIERWCQPRRGWHRGRRLNSTPPHWP